jgi:two-component system, NarL family, nitrate/nitrite response regulator NarL
MISRNNASHQRAACNLDRTDEKQDGATRVVLADDHPILLTGLRALLQPEPVFEIIAAAQDGATALEMIRAHEPEIAVLDICMPKLTGLGVLETLQADDLSTRVVMLAASASDEQIVTGIEWGAWGFLLKECAPDMLIECLKAVASGQLWLPDELVAPAVRRATECRGKNVQPEHVLTAREYEIAGLIAQGLSNKHIARALAIAVGTVKIHLHNMYEKLGGANRTSLAVLMLKSSGPRRTYAS